MRQFVKTFKSEVKTVDSIKNMRLQITDVDFNEFSWLVSIKCI